MTQGIHLIGGGWETAASSAVYEPFLAQAGVNPQVACLLVDEGSGEAEFLRWAQVITSVAPCRPVPILVPIGTTFDPAGLHDVDALLVGGGLTPAYAAALEPVRHLVKDWLQDHPYCGFSAGACVAADLAVTGGWMLDGRPLIPEDSGEDLDEITFARGLGLVPFVVDVHCAPWGTLPRLIAAVGRTGTDGMAIDENTVVSVIDGVVSVSGLGYAHHVVPIGDRDGRAAAVTVCRLAAGDSFGLLD